MAYVRDYAKDAGLPALGSPAQAASDEFAAHYGKPFDVSAATALSGYGLRSAQPQPSTTTNTVSIGTLQVNAPKATDAKGIAKGMRTAMQTNPLIAGQPCPPQCRGDGSARASGPQARGHENDRSHRRSGPTE